MELKHILKTLTGQVKIEIGNLDPETLMNCFFHPSKLGIARQMRQSEINSYPLVIEHDPVETVSFPIDGDFTQQTVITRLFFFGISP